MGDRHHLGLKGMQSDAGNWYELKFTPTNVKVYKDTDVTNTEYDLDIRIPAPTISAPSSVAINGSTISWGTEPQNVDNIIIQRRYSPSSTSTLTDLPSNPTNFNWDDIFDISISSSTQQYIDTPPLAVSEYEYRLKFTNNLGGVSRYTKV